MGLSEFVKERNEALFSLDRDRIVEHSKKYGLEPPKDELVFWAGVYKCICQITSAPEALLNQAKCWLHDHGMSEKITL